MRFNPLSKSCFTAFRRHGAGTSRSISRYPLRMGKNSIDVQELAGVFAVPPLPRRANAKRGLDFDAAELVAQHIEDGGITRYLYGGNAFLYHITLDEYETLLGWLAAFAETRWAIPSVGPSFGRAMDQARLVRRQGFRTVMVLPCNDPRDARGMEAGLREIADACGVPLILYLKSDDGFGANRDAGLDAVGRLVDDGVAIAIKYAVVLDDPRGGSLSRRAPPACGPHSSGQRYGRAARDRSHARLRFAWFHHGVGLHRVASLQQPVRRMRPRGLGSCGRTARRVHAARRPERRVGSRARVAPRNRVGRHRADGSDSTLRLAARRAAASTARASRAGTPRASAAKRAAGTERGKGVPASDGVGESEGRSPSVKAN